MCSAKLLALCHDMPVLLVPSSDGHKKLSDFSTATLDVSISFHESGFDGPGMSCDAQSARFFALDTDATVLAAYKSICEDLHEITFTPQQIGEFVLANRDYLHLTKCSTFFLLRDGERISCGILTPHQSGYLAIRLYIIDSLYVVRSNDQYLFLAPFS